MNLISARDEALEMATDPRIPDDEQRDNAVRAETFHRVLEWRTWVWASVAAAGGWLISRIARSGTSAVAASVAATGAASTAAVIIIAPAAVDGGGHSPAGAVETKTVTVSATTAAPHRLDATGLDPQATLPRPAPFAPPSPSSMPQSRPSPQSQARADPTPAASDAEPSTQHADTAPAAPPVHQTRAANLPATTTPPAATTAPPVDPPPPAQQEPNPPPVESPPAGGGAGPTTGPGHPPILPGLGGLVPSLLPGHLLPSLLPILPGVLQP